MHACSSVLPLIADEVLAFGLSLDQEMDGEAICAAFASSRCSKGPHPEVGHKTEGLSDIQIRIR